MGGETVDSLLAGPGRWGDLWLGSEYGCGRRDAGEFGGVERVKGGCGGVGGEKRTCIPAVEQTLAVHSGGMVMVERILYP